MESNKNSVWRWIYFIPLTSIYLFTIEIVLRIVLRLVVVLYLLIIDDLSMKEVFVKMQAIIPSARYKIITGFILCPIIFLAYYIIGSNIGPTNSKTKQRTLLVVGLLGYVTYLTLSVIMTDMTNAMLAAWGILWLLILKKITRYEEL